MAIRLRAGSQSYTLQNGTAAGAIRLPTLASAVNLLESLDDSRVVRLALVQLGVGGVHVLSESAATRALAELLWVGGASLTLDPTLPIPDVFLRAKPAAPVVASAPPPAREEKPEPEKKKTWITIALVRDDDVPLKGKKYELKLPDGTTRKGTLNADGEVHLEDIDPGQCTVSFPDL